MKRIIVSVSNDLSTDQRVHKVCNSLTESGYDVLLVGRRLPNSITPLKRPYQTKRVSLLFKQGVFFYAELQLRLFLLLLFRRTDYILANDLDTLLPNYIIHKMKGVPLIYDSHELFCEVPELQNYPIKKEIWQSIERFILPRLKHVFTVNESIDKILSKKYDISVNVMRNIPALSRNINIKAITKKELGIAKNDKIILTQGAGINIDRGAEEAVLAMQYISNAVLLIIGKGDVVPELKKVSSEHNLESKVIFIDYVPFEKLHAYTKLASVGLTLDKNTNKNYQYSLPNKLFDYIHAHVPLLASDLVEVKSIIEQYQVGTFIDNHSPEHIAEKINELLGNQEQLDLYKGNCIKAAQSLQWEIEVETLLDTFQKLSDK